MNQPLKIGLLMQGGRGWIGGAEYIKNIVMALSSLPHEVKETFEVHLLCHQAQDIEFQNQLQPFLNKIYILENELKPQTFVNRLKWKINQVIFNNPTDPRFLNFFKKNKFDFIYPYLVPRNLKLPYRGCHWIADFQHKHLPHLFTQSEVELRNKIHKQIADFSDKVILSSKTAEEDLHKFLPYFKCQVEILPFRTSLPLSWYELSTVAVQHKYNLPERFFLLSNQFWQHKNHLVVLDALKILRSNLIYPVVVCTGHTYDYRKPDYMDIILQAISTYGLANQIYLLGLIPKIDQIQLMRHSLAVIQPSLFEGWSTVVEDARCLGKKIILSDIPVHMEQDPPDSVYFDRYSPQQLADLISEWWMNLPSGVNSELENLALKRSEQDVKQYGYQFLEIAIGKQ